MEQIEQLLTFTNENPTDTEKELYLYAGFYVISRSDTQMIYAVCYTEESVRKEFPKQIKIFQSCIDCKSIITFDSGCESVEISGSVDTKIINLIEKRMEELGWK